MDLDALLTQPDGAPLEGVEIIRDVPLQRLGDFEQFAYVVRPLDAARRGPGPAYVCIHGGGYCGGHPSEALRLGTYLARTAGITTIAPNYRLYDGTAPTFPQPVQDCGDALRWVAKNAESWGVDLSRLAIGGFSAGCYLAAMVVVTQGDSELAGGGAIPGGAVDLCGLVGCFGPLDLVARWYDLGERAGSESGLFGEDYLENPSIYHRGSPLTYVRRGLPPAAFIYGRQDRTVHPRQARLGYHAWTSHGNEAEMYVYPEIGHNVEGDSLPGTRSMFIKTREFLQNHLRIGG